MISWIDIMERVVLMLVSAIAWFVSYRHLKKILKTPQSGKPKGRLPKDTKRLVIIGKPLSGKTTLAKIIGYSLLRRKFVCRTALGVPLIKTQGIHYYIFDRIRRTKNAGQLSGLANTLVIADFAGEIRTELPSYITGEKRNGDEAKNKVVFNDLQVEEIRKADIIVEVIYWDDNPKKLQQQIMQYDTAIEKALGIIGSRRYITANKKLFKIVTHLDESKKILRDRDIKVLINRLSMIPSAAFSEYKIIPTNPKMFLELYEKDTNITINQLEKNHKLDELIGAILDSVGLNNKGGGA